MLCVRNQRLWFFQGDKGVPELFRLPCAIIDPPVMLWVMSLSPGFMLSIFAGVVCTLLTPLTAGPRDIVKMEGIGTYLGILATLKERGHPNEPDIVVPHDRIIRVVSWDLEGVLEYCKPSLLNQLLENLGVWFAHSWNLCLPSKLSRPVFS